MSDTDLRMVSMSAEQAKLVEEFAVLLMRAERTGDASSMMALQLGWQFMPSQAPSLPDNVVPIFPQVTHAGDNWSRRAPSA